MGGLFDGLPLILDICKQKQPYKVQTNMGGFNFLGILLTFIAACQQYLGELFDAA